MAAVLVAVVAVVVVALLAAVAVPFVWESVLLVVVVVVLLCERVSDLLAAVVIVVVEKNITHLPFDDHFHGLYIFEFVNKALSQFRVKLAFGFHRKHFSFPQNANFTEVAVLMRAVHLRRSNLYYLTATCNFLRSVAIMCIKLGSYTEAAYVRKN